jgi:hypothetical protein
LDGQLLRINYYMQIIPQPLDILTDNNQWWFIYNNDTKTILQKPLQCVGKTSSPHIMVVADTEQECVDYIIQNNLN